MKHQNVIGIYMDHAKAELIEYTQKHHAAESIASTFTHDVKATSIGKSEQLMHNKEQHSQEAYFKKIGESILKHQHVLLFGPTEAKTELKNALEKDHHFKDIVLTIRDSNKLTPNQKQAFVNDYFHNCI
ncbi:MAG: hypothetical protein WCR21_08780 [Bacteroidota bacterium]